MSTVLVLGTDRTMVKTEPSPQRADSTGEEKGSLVSVTRAGLHGKYYRNTRQRDRPQPRESGRASCRKGDSKYKQGLGR